MTIGALPTPPGPTDDVATFNARAFALLGALPAFVTETNATADDVEADAAAAAVARAAAELAETNAETAQAAALANAQAAAASAGATLWVSGSTYALGVRVYSPITQQLFRRIVAGAGTTDPSQDSTNWARVWVEPEFMTAERFFL